MTPRRRFCPKGHDTFEVGRDSSYRCRRCKYEAKAATRKRATEARRREAEAIAAERAAVAAAQEKAAREQEARREREAQRRREEEYRQALEAGGDTAAEAKWERLSDELLDSTKSRYGLCQWALENGRYGACTRRTAGVYCWVHNRQSGSGVRATAPGEGASFNVMPHPYDSKGVSNMLGLRKKGPDREFSHAPDCKLVKVDPGIKIPWSEIESGHWVAECQCGKEHIHEAPADRRVRLDPLDPSTSRHAPQCEQRGTSDPALLRAILKVREGADGGYWWVECGICEHGWQVPHYATESVR